MKQIKRISILEIDVDAFIVPSKSITVSEIDLTEDRIKLINQIGALNGIGKIKYDSDPMIQLQFIVADNNCINLAFQGINVIDENGFICRIQPEIDLLQASLFEDCKEDDKIVLRIPYKMEDGHEITIIMNTSLKQKEYCYKEYGSFEEAWKYVTSSADISKPVKIAANSCEAAYLEN